MVTIKNPNHDGRQIIGIGVVGPGETLEVSEDVAKEIVDGVNIILVDDAPPADDAEAKKSIRQRSK